MIDARRLTRALIALAIAVPVLLFIAVPMAGVLYESFVVREPMAYGRLRQITLEALDQLPEAQRQANLQRWASAAVDQDRVQALAAAFRHLTGEAPWDERDSFAKQLAAAAAARAALPPTQQSALDAEYPLAVAALTKRVALAFQVRERIGEEGFERLRAGVETRLGIDHYLAPFRDPYLGRAARNSLAIASVTSLATLALALLIGVAVNRGGVACPTLVRYTVLAPLVAPPVVIALALVLLFGRRGLVTKLLLEDTLHLWSGDEVNLYGWLGIVVAQVLSFFPAVFIILDNVMAKEDGRLAESAMGLGAGPWGEFRHVTLPMAWPGLRRGLVLAFIMSLTDFGNPIILGRDTPVLAGIVYDEITGFQNTPLSAAICVWLIGPSLGLYYALEAIGGRRRYAAAGTEAARPELSCLPWGARPFLTVVAVAVCAMIVLLYGTVVAGSLTRVWGVDWTPTLAYYIPDPAGPYGAGGYGSAERSLAVILDSVYTAGLAALIGGAFAVLVAYVIEWLRPPGGNALTFIILLPAVLPGIVFGIGYVVVFNAPFGSKELALTGTLAIVVLNILFGNMFVGVLAGRAALQRLDPAVDEAAENLGAGLARRFYLVVLPLLRRAVILGTLYVFIDGMITLSSVIFLVSGGHRLASVSIFNQANGGDLGYAAAKSVAILAVAVAAMAVGGWIGRAPAAHTAKGGVLHAAGSG